MKFSRPFGLVSSVLLLAVLTACGSSAPAPSTSTSASAVSSPAASSAAASASASPASGGPLTKVTVGLNFAGDEAVFVADARGYFREQGLQVEIVRVATGPEMISLAATNKLDVATGAPSPALFNASSRDITLKIVATKTTVLKESGSAAIVVRKDLYDTGLKEAAGMKGKKIAMNNPAGLSGTYVLRALEPKGVGQNDVSFVQLAFDQMLIGLQNKAVDAAFMVEPFVGTSVDVGAGVILPGGRVTDVALGDPASMVIYAPDFQKSPNATKFMLAFIKGLRDVYSAQVDGKGDRKPIYEIVSKATGVPQATLERQPLNSGEPNGLVKIDRLKTIQTEWLRWGYQQQPVDIDKLVDTTYLDAALKQLGEYKTA